MISYRSNIVKPKAKPKIFYRYNASVRSNGKWTEEETKALIKAYHNKVERRLILEMFPEKSSGAVASKAAKLGLKRK